MTATLGPKTEELLQEMAQLWDWDAEELADTLLLEALEAAKLDCEETCQAIAVSLAKMDAGRTTPFEEVWAQWEAEKAGRANLPKRTGILGL